MSPVDISVATAPNDLAAVPGLFEDIAAGINTLGYGGDEARHELIIKVRTLVQALETPRETMIKHCWAQTSANAGLVFGVDTGLWAIMAENGDRPQKVAELAKAINCEEKLLSRLMRHLGAMGYIRETNVDEYRPTNFSKSLSIPIIGDGYPCVLGKLASGPNNLFEFARRTGYRNPTDATDTSLMQACKTKKDMFTMVQELGYGPHFHHHMGGYRQGRLPWFAPSFFPVADRLMEDANPSPGSAFIVDIGGSVGHDLEAFHRAHPMHPGRLILQDLPVVIGQIKQLDPAIDRMEYDFHTEQPVKGARAYFLHSILHDWPDSVCKNILARVGEAMTPGYSKLLVNENVIPDKGAYWETSALDVQMMAMFSAQERTEADWRHLLEDVAGMRIIKIWNGGKGVESLIEVEKRQ